MGEKLTLPDGTAHEFDPSRCSVVAPKAGVLKSGYSILTEKGNTYRLALVISGVGSPKEKAVISVGSPVNGAVRAMKRNAIADAAMAAVQKEAVAAGAKAAEPLKAILGDEHPMVSSAAAVVAKEIQVAAAHEVLAPLDAEDAVVAATDLAEKIKASQAAIAKLG